MKLNFPLCLIRPNLLLFIIMSTVNMSQTKNNNNPSKGEGNGRR